MTESAGDEARAGRDPPSEAPLRPAGGRRGAARLPDPLPADATGGRCWPSSRRAREPVRAGRRLQRRGPQNVEGSVVPRRRSRPRHGRARCRPAPSRSARARSRCAHRGETLTTTTIFGYVLGGPGAPTRLVDGRLPSGPGEGVASDIDASTAASTSATTCGWWGRARVDPHRRVGGGEPLQCGPHDLRDLPDLGGLGAGQEPDAQAVSRRRDRRCIGPERGPAPIAERITREVEAVEALDRDARSTGFPGRRHQSSFAIILRSRSSSSCWSHGSSS